MESTIQKLRQARRLMGPLCSADTRKMCDYCKAAKLIREAINELKGKK